MSDTDFQENRVMDSDLRQNAQKQQMNSGLARYQSAPSSYFSNFVADVEALANPPRPLSPQTDRILEQLLSETSTSHGDIQQNNNPFMKQETEEFQMMYQSPAQLHLPSQDSLGTEMGNSYDMMSTGRINNVPQMKMDGGFGKIAAHGSSNSNLIRHRSSPAGLFSQLNIENGFMDTISEIVNKNVEQLNPTFGQLGSEDIGNYMTGFPVGSWDDSATLPDNFSIMKRTRDDTAVVDGNENEFSGSNASDSQHGEFSGNRFPAAVLSHHLSLPKSSIEMMSATEKFMQFQDSSVSCKLRAKRGCATHPRSIAERVRRTRISERMRKLQELVPNMDKQTNTADMLDLAVDYIKDLQTQVKILMVNREQCTCSD